MAINDPADSDRTPNERLITYFVNKNVVIAVFQNKSVLLANVIPKNFGLQQQQQLHIYGLLSLNYSLTARGLVEAF